MEGHTASNDVESKNTSMIISEAKPLFILETNWLAAHVILLLIFYILVNICISTNT